MKKIIIETRKGEKYECLLDDADYEVCAKRLWAIKKYPNSIYAVTNYIDDNGKRTTVTMHRYVMFGDDFMNHKEDIVDHLNGNCLDNRRSNLRSITALQRSQNRQRAGSNNTSGIVGVSYRETKWGASSTPSGEWVASITVDSKMKSKRFACKKFGEEEAKQMAIEQRNAWEKEYYNR